jgi:hypothetical protein
VSNGIARSHVAWSVRSLARTSEPSHVDANAIARGRTKSAADPADPAKKSAADPADAVERVSRASAGVSLVMRSTGAPEPAGLRAHELRDDLDAYVGANQPGSVLRGGR